MKDPPGKQKRSYVGYVFAVILGVYLGMFLSEMFNTGRIKVPPVPQVKEPSSYHQQMEQYIEPPVFYDSPATDTTYSDDFYYVGLNDTRCMGIRDWQPHGYIVAKEFPSLRLNL